MATQPDQSNSIATLTLAELREFASFNAAEQRYIKRALDVGLSRQDAFARWARDAEETASIRMQYLAYQDLDIVADNIPDGADDEGHGEFMALLMRLASFDVSQGKLECFSSFRFLYERLIGRKFVPGCPAPIAPLRPCPKFHHSAAKCCCNPSVKPRRLRLAGHNARPHSSRNGLIG